MNTIITEQRYDQYREEDHLTWATLAERHMKKNFHLASKEYKKGFLKLSMDLKKIVKIDELNQKLRVLAGWTLVPVGGLIPTKDFLYLLINKKYPVTVAMREPDEIDFSKNPDIFHDIFGHVPLLINEKFNRFLTIFSMVALRHVENERSVESFGRLYWYTYEMGLIREDGLLKPYGGAIITSRAEIDRVHSPEVPKHPFDVEKIFSTPYNPFKLQNEYFTIGSFDDLFNCAGTMEEKLNFGIEPAPTY